MRRESMSASERRTHVDDRNFTPKQAAQRHYILQYDARLDEANRNAQLESVVPHQARPPAYQLHRCATSSGHQDEGRRIWRVGLRQIDINAVAISVYSRSRKKLFCRRHNGLGSQPIMYQPSGVSAPLRQYMTM